MKTIRTLLLIFAASCFLQLGARANDIEPGKEFYTAIKTPNPIVLDGDLSEWQGAALLADPRFSIPKGSGDDGELVFFELYNGGDWTGPDDHTSAVQVVYDDDNVYFGFIVTDEYHENAANSPWNGDSVQLMIANDQRDTQVALYNYSLGGVEGSLGDIIIEHEAGPGGTEAVVTRNSETQRTTYEIKLPKEALALVELTGGTQFGLGMAINDGDEATPGQKGWGGLGAHSIVFGKTPQETALVTLAVSNDIEPGKEFYTANPAANAIVLDGDLGDWSGVPVLSDPRFSIPKGSGREGELVLFEIYNGGDWTGPDDHTSAVQIVYDQDNVYFGFVVTDEYHENSANSAWNGDSIQLMIANDKQDSQIALYNYALGGVEGNLGEIIVMHEAGPGGTEAVVIRDSETQRTTYEIKLPKESLGLDALELGTMFGLGMAINDGDEATPGQKGWGGLGAHSIVFGKTPSETALVTLGIGGNIGDLAFLSAISPSLEGFAFRVNDKGDSIVDPASVKLFIDGQLVELEASPKKFDATDFRHTFTGPFESNTGHTYTIELQDFNGNVVTETSTFRAPIFSLLTPCMMAVEVDTSQPGFLWRVIQNDFAPVTNLGETELLLAGELPDGFGALITDNFAYNDGFFGPALGAGVMDGLLLEFEIPTVINLSAAGDFAIVGNFDPKEQMPGVPGNFFGINGAAAEIITFIEFPAGVTTMGVNSDDGFRTEGGFIDDPEHRELMGEFPTTRTAADGTFLVSVEEAGVYPVRTIWWNNTDQDASIEIFTVMEDGTKVLVNDIENGGLKAYRSGVIPVFDPECAPAPVLTGPVVNFRLDGNHDSSTEFGSGSLMGGIPGTPGDLPALVGGVTGEAGDQAAEFTGNGSNVAYFEDADGSMNFDDQDYTLEAWVKIGSPNAAGDGNPKGIIAAYGLPGGYSMWITAEGTIGGTTYGLVDLFTEAVVPADGWHHVAEVHEIGAEVRFYIDGALAHTLAETRGVNPSGDHTLYVGYERASADPINPFNGLIDRVRVTPKALAPDEFDLTPGPPVIPALGLNIGVDVDGNIVLDFEGDLMEADNVDGPYVRVDGAASPMTVSPNASRKFYQSSN